MNVGLIRNIAWDLLVTAPLLYFGGYEHFEFAENAMLFIFWVSTIIAMLVVISGGSMDWSDIKKKTPAHNAYSSYSIIIESMILFALGYSWLGVMYFVFGIAYCSTRQEKGREA